MHGVRASTGYLSKIRCMRMGKMEINTWSFHLFRSVVPAIMSFYVLYINV